MCCSQPLSVSKAIPDRKRVLLTPAMTGIFNATLTVWGPKASKSDLRFDMEASKFNDALKRAFELKNVVRAKTVPGHQPLTFRMWPHPHDVVQGWENGQDHIDVVSEVMVGNNAPDEAPERLHRFQKDGWHGEKGWWHPPMAVIRAGFQERPRVPVPPVEPPTATTTSTEAITRVRPDAPASVQTEPPPKRHKKGRGTFNKVGIANKHRHYSNHANKNTYPAFTTPQTPGEPGG